MAMTHLMLLWMKSRKYSLEDVSKRIRGPKQASPKYLRNILMGYQRPGFPLAEALSEVTGGAISPLYLMQFYDDRQRELDRTKRKAG